MLSRTLAVALALTTLPLAGTAAHGQTTVPSTRSCTAIEEVNGLGYKAAVRNNCSVRITVSYCTKGPWAACGGRADALSDVAPGAVSALAVERDVQSFNWSSCPASYQGRSTYRGVDGRDCYIR